MRPDSYNTVRPWHPEPLTPRDVHTRLDEAFDGRIRLRWSLREGLWHVEQKLPSSKLTRVAKQLKRPDAWFDELTRFKDGYNLVMKVANGDRLPCPACSTTLKIPAMETHEVICDKCRQRGWQSKVVAGYYPLGWPLIDHLKTLDPQRTDVRRVAEADAANNQWQAALKRAAAQAQQYGLKDALIDQIPTAGFTHRMSKRWQQDAVAAALRGS